MSVKLHTFVTGWFRPTVGAHKTHTAVGYWALTTESVATVDSQA